MLAALARLPEDDCRRRLAAPPFAPIPPHGVVVTGSFNWTRAATLANRENALVVADADTAREYARRFEALLTDAGTRRA